MPVIVGVGGSISCWEDLLIDYLTNVGLFEPVSAYTLTRHPGPAFTTSFVPNAFRVVLAHPSETETN